MSSIRQISVLALLSTAFAQPHQHGHQHAQFHGSLTGTWGTGTRPFHTGSGTHFHASTGTGFSTRASSSPTDISSPVASSSTVNVWDTTTDCTSDVTVTSTEKTTVYVTASTSTSVRAVLSSSKGSIVTTWSTSVVTKQSTLPATPSSSSSASSSAAVSPVSQSSATLSSSTVSTTSTTSETSATPTSSPVSSTSSSFTTTSTTAAAPTTSSSSSSSVWVAPSVPTSAPVEQALAPTSATWSPSSTSAAAASSTGSSGSGKRGLAYNNAGLTSMFIGAPSVSWAYNWAATSKGEDGQDLPSGVNYIPLLHGLSDIFTGSWLSDVQTALSGGSTHIFSFNEPDLSTQANILPAAAAAAWPTYLEPFAGKAKICAPAVTNGGGSMGLTWLSHFLDSCSSCTIDCLNIHWYDSAENVAYFKEHVTNATSLRPGTPVFISEFGASGSDDEVNSFLQEVMPWMDSNSDVAGYAYFMVKDSLLVNGNEPSTYGWTFRNYTSSS